MLLLCYSSSGYRENATPTAAKTLETIKKCNSCLTSTWQQLLKKDVIELTKNEVHAKDKETFSFDLPSRVEYLSFSEATDILR